MDCLNFARPCGFHNVLKLPSPKIFKGAKNKSVWKTGLFYLFIYYIFPVELQTPGFLQPQ